MRISDWSSDVCSSDLAQAQAMRVIVETQVNRIGQWLQQLGVTTMPGDLGPEDFKSLAQQAMSSLGRVTAAVGIMVGAVTSGVMMLVLAIFIAIEPKIYERRSEEHTSELQSLMRISSAVFCLKNKHMDIT